MGLMDSLKTTRKPVDIVEMELLNHCLCHGTSFLSAKLLEEDHVLQVCQDATGIYLGYMDDTGPISRDSDEYFPNLGAAGIALANHDWVQRMDP